MYVYPALYKEPNVEQMVATHGCFRKQYQILVPNVVYWSYFLKQALAYGYSYGLKQMFLAGAN